MDEFYQLLKDDPAIKAIVNHKEGLSSLSEVEETLLMAVSFYQQKRNQVIVKSNMYTAQQLYNRLYPLLKEDVLLFTMEESLRVEAVAASPDNYATQMEVLSTLLTSEKPKLIITNPMAIIRYLPSKEVFAKHILKLKVGQLFSMEEMRILLIEAGYKQTARVDQPLTFSLRGGVVDVFSIQNDNPLRIEFFDDEIDSLRYFDISSQRTVEKINECTVVPAGTLIYDNYQVIEDRVIEELNKEKAKAINFSELEENIRRDLSYIENHVNEHYLYRYQCFMNDRVSILDYVDNPFVILSKVEDIDANLDMISSENNNYIKELFEDCDGLNYYSLFDDFGRVTDKFETYKIMSLGIFKDTIRSDIRMVYFPLLPIDKTVDELVRLSQRNHITVSLNKLQYQLLQEAFNSADLDIEETISQTSIDLSEGFTYHDEMYLTAKELFGVKVVKGRYESKFKEATVLENYTDLNINDYVVHNQYGIGRYEGIITKEIQGKHRDYLQIRYKDDDMLLVPLEQFKLVRKFVAAEGVGVRLSKLGSASWGKTKAKISEEVTDIAQRLIELYSEREKNIGFAFSKDDEVVREFENNFPYELTPDQIRAIAEVKYDMEQPKPMDRLLCGDVGFGKTEVAMVAAFKAVKDLKQVAYLCPTTILSRQHFNTFTERFKGFPVKIKLINRFVLESEQKQILKDLKEGKIDILIGTHRLLSDDVKFADLGLLIIDEEQRFGVQAKEKIKELKKSIDVLSLSATPIPRTLQMSLVGVMSLSQLETAPVNRMPIQTYVVEKNDSLIREVIQRELARNGQVFYLHNNISDIYDIARKIQLMVPSASIAIGHGQMSRDEIEDVMYRFTEGQYNILICTTIIETGIDIPNVNTILIDNADTFGLSQLYQIRGRVGRSDRLAYAYLMYRGKKQLSEVAYKRLQAIKDFTELGSGYKIALRDLTIRGAGDLLGERQAGFINTIGMSLYLDMLNKAIKQQKGIVEEVIEEAPIKVNDIDGYIPKQFVHEDYEKITIYNKLAKINDQQKLDEYLGEVTDYYGKLPTSISNLFLKKKMEIMLNNVNVERYDQGEKENRIVLTKEFSNKVDGVKLFGDISNISSEIKMRYSQGKIAIIIPKRKNFNYMLEKVMQAIEESEKKED